MNLNNTIKLLNYLHSKLRDLHLDNMNKTLNTTKWTDYACNRYSKPQQRRINHWKSSQLQRLKLLINSAKKWLSGGQFADSKFNLKSTIHKRLN